MPLDVAASGPKVIGMSAPLAERITFSVGAIPERLQWAVDAARAARSEHALTDAGISYGAQIIVVCHPNLDEMLPLAASFVAPLARFQVIQGAAAGPESADDELNLAAIRNGYDMTKHGAVSSREKIIGPALTSEFVQRFAIVGPPDHCAERSLQLIRWASNGSSWSDRAFILKRRKTVGVCSRAKSFPRYERRPRKYRRASSRLRDPPLQPIRRVAPTLHGTFLARNR